MISAGPNARPASRSARQTSRCICSNPPGVCTVRNRTGSPGPLAGPAVYVDLVHRRHWPSAQYATWLTGQLDHATRLKEDDRT